MTSIIIFFCIAPPVILALLMSRFSKRSEYRFRTAPFFAFCFGGIVVGLALVIQIPLLPMLQHMGGMKVLFLAFVIAGLVEESVKLGALRLIVGPKIPTPKAAIVLGIAAGCGFAAVENLVIVFSAQAVGGNGLDVAISRALTSVPAHAAFGAVMGFCLSRTNLGKVGRYGLALLMPIFLHGWFNAPQLWAVQAGLSADGRFALPVLASTWVLVALIMDIARREAKAEAEEEIIPENSELIPIPVPVSVTNEQA